MTTHNDKGNDEDDEVLDVVDTEVTTVFIAVTGKASVL